MSTNKTKLNQLKLSIDLELQQYLYSECELNLLVLP